MKKCVTLLIACLIALSGFSQFYLPQEKHEVKWGEYGITAGLALLSGVCEGVQDGLQFHYDKPDQFWNPSISWTNKYRNHDPAQGMTFRGRFLTFTTDGWHLMKFGRNLFTSGAVALQFTNKKEKWWVYVVKGLGFWAVNRAGFVLAYSRF